MALYSQQQRIDPARLAYLRLMAGSQTQDADDIATFRDYYRGEHPTMLTQRLASFLNVSTGATFCENYCALVVDSLAERLHVTGFATGDDATDALLRQWWQANRMDGQSGELHTYAARDGAAYIIVEWSTERARPVFHVNEAWDGDEGVKAHWAGKPGASGRVLFASKRWREEFDRNGEIDAYRRMNLYFPDRIEKYRSGANGDEGGWVRFLEDGETEWPTPWVNARGEPLGVPVIPFLNRRTGVSELENVISVQNAINKTMIDMLAASDVEGFGIYVKTGGSFVEGARVFPGAFWQDTDPSAAFSKLPGATLAGLLSAHDTLVRSLAVITRRPLSYFTGASDAVSGESMKQREAGLIGQAKDACVVFGNAWEDVMHFAAKLDRVYGAGQVPEDMEISTLWADVETRNEEAHAAGVILRFEKGVIDKEQAWDELGYAQDVQAAMLRRAATKETQAIATAVRLSTQAPAREEPEEESEEEPEESEET